MSKADAMQTVTVPVSELSKMSGNPTARKWAGGVYAPGNGNIYGIPFHTRELLIINSDPASEKRWNVASLSYKSISFPLFLAFSYFYFFSLSRP